MKIKNSTRQQYKKLLTQLKRWAHPRPLVDLTQADIDRYEQHLINDRQLAPASLNNHRQAINKYFAAIGGDIRLTLRSTRSTRAIHVITPAQANAIIAAVPEFYRPIIEAIYRDCRPPGAVVAGVVTPRGRLTLAAVNNRIAAAAAEAGVLHRCRAKMLHQSGIVHAIQLGVDTGWLMAQAGIGRGTLARYVQVAQAYHR